MSKYIEYISQKDFDKKVVKNKKPVIVDFYSQDCPPCEVLAPIYDKMAEKYHEYIDFVKILRQDNRELASTLGVSGSPTLLFYKEGKEVGYRVNGCLGKPEVRIAIEDVLVDVITEKPLKKIECDLVILGAGSAGLSAAIYAARAKLDTHVLDQSVPGGQVATTFHIENYPGIEGRVRGKEIVENMKNQALSFGAKIDDLKEIFEVNHTKKIKYIRTEDTEYFSKSVIIASGAKPRELPAIGADDFKGKGIHYCATCDGAMYENRDIVVVGGGNSAVEEAIFLTKFANSVTIVHQFDHFQASKKAQEEAFENDKIKVIWDCEVRKVNGKGHSIESLELENIKTNERNEISTNGAFVYIGTSPMSKPFEGQVELDKWGYIIASEDTVTSTDGVFVAGDIRTKAIRQAVTAASDGAVAGIMAERYIAEMI